MSVIRQSARSQIKKSQIKKSQIKKSQIKKSQIKSWAAVMMLLLLISAPWSVYAADRPGAAAVPLAGTWSLVAVDNVLPDHSRVHLYGPGPQGILTFDAAGRYTLQIYRAGRTKFVSDDKSKGTAEENSAMVQGANSHFGKYAISEADHTVTFQIEHASFPNWDETEQKRSYTIDGDRLKYVVPTPTSGGAVVGEVEWKRLP